MRMMAMIKVGRVIIRKETAIEIVTKNGVTVARNRTMAVGETVATGRKVVVKSSKSKELCF